MDEFTDEDIQLSIESEDDTRISLTLVSLSGKKITMQEFIYEIECYLQEIEKAEQERINMGAVNQ